MRTQVLALAAILSVVFASGSLLRAQTTHPSGIQYDTLARNQIRMWVSNIGSMSHDPNTDLTGFAWPRGSGHTYIYQDGFCFVGLSEGAIRAGGTMYNFGWQPGHIRADGTASDPTNPLARIFRVRRLNPLLFPSLDANEQARLRRDYGEWPVHLDAPWIDVNHDGEYEPDFDAWIADASAVDGPALMGDEMLWSVMNDRDTLRTRDVFGDKPISIEVSTTAWAYDVPDCRGRTVFMRHRLINKGIAAIDSMYFCIWSDPDVGYAADDLAAIDTVRQLAYVHNALPYDSLFGNTGAVGYVLLQGPTVPAPGEVARSGGRTIADSRNLPVTAFTYYANAILPYTDPSLKQPFGAWMLLCNASGRFSYGQPMIDPHTGDTTMFAAAGDPVTGTGWLDGQVLPPGDRRLLVSSGPYTLSTVDTQEVVYARIVAEGGTPAEDVMALRETADCVTLTYRDTPLSVAASLPDARGFAMTAVYPNPYFMDTHLNIGIQLQTPDSHPLIIIVADMLGRRITSIEIASTPPLTAVRLSLPSSIASGVYSVIASDGTTESMRHVMIVR